MLILEQIKPIVVVVNETKPSIDIVLSLPPSSPFVHFSVSIKRLTERSGSNRETVVSIDIDPEHQNYTLVESVLLGCNNTV